MDKYSSKVCISSSPFSMFPYFDLRRAVTGSYSRGKNRNKSKKTTVYGESFYYSVHDAYAAMLNEHTIQWHVRKGCIAQLIHASSGLVLGCRDLILLVLGIACIDVRIMLPHSRAELHDDTFVALKCTVSRGQVGHPK